MYASFESNIVCGLGHVKGWCSKAENALKPKQASSFGATSALVGSLCSKRRSCRGVVNHWRSCKPYMKSMRDLGSPSSARWWHGRARTIFDEWTIDADSKWIRPNKALFEIRIWNWNEYLNTFWSTSIHEMNSYTVLWKWVTATGGLYLGSILS